MGLLFVMSKDGVLCSDTSSQEICFLKHQPELEVLSTSNPDEE